MTDRVWGCRSQNFNKHKFNVFRIKFTRLIIKSFKGVVFASIVFDVYLQINDVNIPYLEKMQTCIKNIFCLNNDWNVIISKAEKVQICGKRLIALASYTVRNAYCLTARKQLSDMNVLY